ncbi:MAG TPA: protein kinase [Candidatus Angelobacter sp.]
MTEAWSERVGQVLSRGYHLHKYLGGSDESAVFLTGRPGNEDLLAAVKLVPSGAHAELRLSQWQRAQTLSHPHLIQIFDTGRSQIDDIEVVFVVMEYAEENLAQILPERALTAAETQEMLWPALDALAYLHGQELIHGCLNPANILAINDQLKLASDGICREGESVSQAGQSSVYDPPEQGCAACTPAADIWSLGMTLAEVLTQRMPAWDQREQLDPTLPESLPEPFADIVRGCLRHDPARRWTLADIAIRLRPDSSPVAPPPVVVPAPPPVTAPTPVVPSFPVAAPRPAARRRSVLPVVAAVVVAVLLAVWAVLGRHETGPNASKPSDPKKVSNGGPAESGSRSKPSPVTNRPDVRSAATPRPPAQVDEVVHRTLPDVPQAARDSIQGTIRVGVKVQVDGAGGVVGSALEFAGPSQYFARLALQAAQGWKFAQSSQDAGRTFILRFQFTNHDTKASAVRSAH